MRSFFWASAVVGLVAISADRCQAQWIGGFGLQHGAVVQFRSGPFFWWSARGGFSASYSSFYGIGPGWYYAWPAVPAVAYPVYIQPPAIIVYNVVNPIPAAIPRNAAVPPDAEPPAPPPPKAPKLGPAPRENAPPAPPPPAKPLGRADADRFIETGRNAFADGQYGRALEMFLKALAIVPNEPSVHFVVSQAYFALGKYAEAVAALSEGIDRRPDWSAARFNVRDLYWKNPGQYDEHLQALRQAAAAYPNDAALNFLLGHQLWFDGRRDEARALILKARQLAGNAPAAKFKLD